MSIKTNLVKEFENEIKELGKLPLGSEEYESTLDGVTKLADRIIEIDKLESENNEKDRQREVDVNLKVSQMESENRDRLIRNCIEGTKVIGGFGLATWAFVASMNFEKEGTLTTEGGRTALRQLLKFIK